MTTGDWRAAFKAAGWSPTGGLGEAAAGSRFTIPSPGAPPGAVGVGDVESRIRRVAAQRGFSDPDLLVATARRESGLDPFVKGGDAGKSWGVFQEHDAGRGAGLSVAQRQDVDAATGRAIDEFTAIRQRFPDVDRGTWAARAQRPYDPVGYAAGINRDLAGRPAAAGPPATTPAVGGLGGDWKQAFRNAGWRPEAGAGTGGAGAGSGPPPRPAEPQGVVFPVAGYTGKVDLHHGAHSGVGGSDLFAAEGTPVVSMVPGTVQWASTNDSLGGNNVGILGDDGLTYYYAHFKNAPRVKVGERIGAGQQIGDVGRSGNAAGTPPHLHIGIGRGIQTGAGAQGGLGREFDAVAYLRRALSGAAPAHPDAPAVGRFTSGPAGGSGPGGDWKAAFAAAGWRP